MNAATVWEGIVLLVDAIKGPLFLKSGATFLITFVVAAWLAITLWKLIAARL